VVATDDIYVVYNSLARQTSTHPSNQALQATSGSFSGAVSAASATVTGDLTVDTNTLYVDSTNNRVGVGTTSPETSIHAAKSNSGGMGAELTLDNPSTSAISNATGINFLNDSGASVSGVANGRIRSVTNNASTGAADIQFHTWNGSAEAERMRIDSSGNVIVGDTTNFGAGNGFMAKAAGTAALCCSRTSDDGATVRFYRDNTEVGSISVTGSATAYNTSSDYRLKENVTADWDATTRLKQLNPVRFNFIADPDTTVDGFLAHEVQDIVPEAISGKHNGMRDEEYEVTPAVLDEDGNVVTPAVMGTRSVPDYQGIDQSKLVPLLVKTIQELEARIAALENA